MYSQVIYCLDRVPAVVAKTSSDFESHLGWGLSLRSARFLNVAYWQIVLQKSKVAGRRIFRENPKREALANLYDLNRITEVACESNVRR